MLTLILLRHAKAEPAVFGGTDSDRSLAPRGRTDAPRMGAMLANAGLVPDLVLCSTARRTRETFELAATAFGLIEHKLEPAIYEATPMRLLGIVRRVPDGVKRLLLIGHNPGLEELTRDLIGTSEPEAIGRLNLKFSTSGLAVLTLPVTNWAKITPRSAHLALFTAPRYLPG